MVWLLFRIKVQLEDNYQKLQIGVKYVCLNGENIIVKKIYKRKSLHGSTFQKE